MRHLKESLTESLFDKDLTTKITNIYSASNAINIIQGVLEDIFKTDCPEIMNIDQTQFEDTWKNGWRLRKFDPGATGLNARKFDNVVYVQYNKQFPSTETDRKDVSIRLSFSIQEENIDNKTYVFLNRIGIEVIRGYVNKSDYDHRAFVNYMIDGMDSVQHETKIKDADLSLQNSNAYDQIYDICEKFKKIVENRGFDNIIINAYKACGDISRSVRTRLENKTSNELKPLVNKLFK